MSIYVMDLVEIYVVTYNAIIFDDLLMYLLSIRSSPQWAGIIISHISNCQDFKSKMMNAYVVRDHFEVCLNGRSNNLAEVKRPTVVQSRLGYVWL